MKTPKKVDLSQEEYEQLQERLKKRELQDSDYELLSGALQFMLWLQNSLKEAKISISRLSKLFGFSPRSKKRRTGPRDYNPSSADDESDGAEGTSESANSATPEDPPPKKGHGRLPHSAYTGAPTIKVAHPTLKGGDPCPLNCGGTISIAPFGHVIRVTGSPIAAATRYQLEKFRCNLCGEYFAAPFPVGVSPEDKYDAQAKSSITIQKYFMGSPFHRIATFQSLVGMPLAESTAWELSEEVANIAYPVFKQLIVDGAQGEVLHNDDANVKILSLMKENQQEEPPERKGMYTSGILSKIRLPDSSIRQIALFISGRHHAGNNLDFVLKHRAKELGPAIQMSDALSSSKTQEVETIACSCLSHGFRKFEDIADYWPQECHYVMKGISDVYDNEDQTEDQQLSPRQRLAFHQQHSKPIMDELKQWFDDQKASPHFDPSSSLGKAIQYMLNHWDKLTQFLRIPGAPLDNNNLEQSLKVPIRNRKNAYFYKTEHGALVGDIHMSIIYTCWLNGINPFDYLVQLQHDASEVFKTPQRFMPWNYQETIGLLAQDIA